MRIWQSFLYGMMYLQLGGGSRVISANSFWILFADVDNALDPKAFDVRSLVLLSARSRSVDAGAVEDEFDEDMINYFLVFLKNKFDQ